MTTTANKGGLRAAASAKREKAAQRTPLPPPPPARSKASKVAEKAVPAETIQDKAARYAADLEKLGWKPEIVRKDGLVELTAIRGTEALYLSWFKEAHISGGSTYTYADHTVKVRNPAEAMRIAARTPDESKDIQAKVSSNKARYGKRPDGPTIRSVPFDPAEVSDEELLDAIRARRVTWRHSDSPKSETAIVGERVTVARHGKGHRIVSFCDPEFGFRAFKLDNLENVGRKVNIERIKQEILASLTKFASKESKRAKAQQLQ